MGGIWRAGHWRVGGDRKGGRRHNRGNWVVAGRDECTGHIVRRLLSAMPLKEEEASCRNDASLRYPWGLACSEFPQCLHILAIRLIRVFHNVGLDLYICDTVCYVHCRKIIKFRLLKKNLCPYMALALVPTSKPVTPMITCIVYTSFVKVRYLFT